MAKSRRTHRRGSRKAHRKSHSRTHRRRTHRGGKGLFSTIYGPVGHLLAASGETVGTVTNTTRNMLRRGIRGVDGVGKSATGHLNSAVRNLVSRKRRNNRK